MRKKRQRHDVIGAYRIQSTRILSGASYAWLETKRQSLLMTADLTQLASQSLGLFLFLISQEGDG